MSFKVGDWVRIFGTTTRITWTSEHNGQIEYYNTVKGNYRDGMLDPTGLELWQPKESEWCWFFDNENTYILSKYKGINNHTHLYKEPFIGQLPSFIQDNQC